MTTGRPLVEIVPNFSEGRRQDVIDAIVAALQVPGVILLNTQWDPDHNRLDCSLIGDPDAVRRSALAGAAKAVELIDMEQHEGSHPRMGAVDVIPFLPIRDTTMQDCVELARSVGRELADTLHVPVYLYDQAALSPERASLAEVRKGQYEGLREAVARGERLPDFGPHVIGKAGAVAVGARKPLVAFNVYFDSHDEDAVKAVAKRVRESSGGLRNVRAVGFAVPERGMVTVSMNLVDTDVTPIYRALELVKAEAARHGLAVKDTEIVGLVPQAAIAETAEYYLQLQGFEPDEQILESLVGSAADISADSPTAQGLRGRTLDGFLAALASPDPTPGGGSAAAVTGATGAALVAMVGRLTAGKKGYEAVTDRMHEIVAQADQAREAFLALADRDAEAFDGVMAAFKLPKETDQDKAARSAAIQLAYTAAAEVPMDVARRAASLVELAREAVETGNPNAASDGAAAANILFAATEAALANVDINLASMKDRDLAVRMHEEVATTRQSAGQALVAVNEAFHRAVAPG